MKKKYQKFDIKDKIKQSSWKCEVGTACWESLLCVHNCAERNNISWRLQHFDLKRTQKKWYFHFQLQQKSTPTLRSKLWPNKYQVPQQPSYFLATVGQLFLLHGATLLIVLFQNATFHLKFFKTNILWSGNPQKMSRIL